MAPFVARPAQAHEVPDTMPAFTSPLAVVNLVAVPTTAGALPVLPLPNLLPCGCRDGAHRRRQRGFFPLWIKGSPAYQLRIQCPHSKHRRYGSADVLGR